MKLNLILTFLASAGVVAADTVKTPEQLRGQLKRSLTDTETTNAPTAGGDGVGGDGVEGGDGETEASPTPCFSRFNDVEVQGQGMTSMDAVKVGDYVRTGNADFSRVFSLAHLDHDFEANFLQIYADGLQKPLEITGIGKGRSC